MKIHSLKEARIKKGTRVLIRADFDVALRNGKIIDPFRPEKVLPALRYILKQGARVRLLAHLGRPRGKKVPALSLKPFVSLLSKKIDRRVVLMDNPLDEGSFAKFDNSSEVLLFENMRYWPGEERNSRDFASKLARWGDIYINEAFANSHRSHASVVSLAKILPSFAGPELVKEIYHLGILLQTPKQPYVALVGGIKLETKLPLVKRFLQKADKVLIGSGFAGALPARHPRNLYVPLDYIVHKGKKVDIGPETFIHFRNLLSDAKTIVWNGPLGFTPYFPNGTREIAKVLAKSPAFVVVGGGDTVAALEELGISLHSFDHVSAGGGAMLEMLAGEKLPAIEALKR